MEFMSRFPHSPKSLDFGPWPLGHGLCVLGFGLWTLGFGFKILDFRYCTPDFGRWALDLRFWTLDFWSLDSTFGSTLDSELEALDLGF